MRNAGAQHFAFSVGADVQYPVTPDVLSEIAGDGGDDRSQQEDAITDLTLQMREIATRMCRSVKVHTSIRA